jgi:hypothetical protein
MELLPNQNNYIKTGDIVQHKNSPKNTYKYVFILEQIESSVLIILSKKLRYWSIIERYVLITDIFREENV